MSTTHPTLFDPVRLGDIALASRIVMAPLTRNRAVGTLPNALMAEYYAQRADPATGAGLIVAEATQISAMGQGYLDTPGIHSPEQVAGWKRVTDAVHARGGRIALQLWHVGRISHSSLLGGAAPLSCTTVAAESRTLTTEGWQACSAPRQLREDEMPAIVAEYAHAARCAMDAGFDGVEVHGANGYLIDQHLRDSVNVRSDAYGGPIAHRIRLLVEVMQAVVAVAGAGRTGLRISPISPVNGAALDSHPLALHLAAAAALAPLKLAFVHVIEGQTGGPRELPGVHEAGVVAFDYPALRAAWGAPWIVNNGYDRGMAMAEVAAGRADAVAFGRPFIANPDLGARLRLDAPLNASNSKTFYKGGALGYTDYPVLDGAAA